MYCGATALQGLFSLKGIKEEFGTFARSLPLNNDGLYPIDLAIYGRQQNYDVHLVVLASYWSLVLSTSPQDAGSNVESRRRYFQFVGMGGRISVEPDFSPDRLEYLVAKHAPAIFCLDAAVYELPKGISTKSTNRHATLVTKVVGGEIELEESAHLGQDGERKKILVPAKQVSEAMSKHGTGGTIITYNISHLH